MNVRESIVVIIIIIILNEKDNLHTQRHTHRQQINCGWSLDCLIMIYALPLAGVTPPPQDETNERHENILVYQNISFCFNSNIFPLSLSDLK